MSRHPAPLKFLFPGWYAVVMGLAGLALAWHRAEPVLGAAAGATARVLGLGAAAAFVVLLGATVLRVQRHRDSWLEDLRHPVRHAFVAAIPIALLLLTTVAVALGIRHAALALLWWLGSLVQLAVTLWVLSRWWRGPQAGGLPWAGVTPALFIPIVGNVLVPLAGVPLGFGEWSAAQFGIGLLFWPVVLALLIARLVVQGPWPDRLMPTTLIIVAPPAVVALAALQFDAPPVWAWILWGMALFALLWSGAVLARRIAALPFGLPHWGMSFPLAAFAALSLRLAEGGAMRLFALAALALATLVIAALSLATWRGLRHGTLLAPEPVAAIQPATG
jgi:tellurite resistance protein